MRERVKEAGEVHPALSRVEKVHRTTRMIVLSLAASMVIYTAVGLAVLDEQASDQVKATALLAALALSLASIAVRRVQLGRIRVESIAHRRGLNGLINHLFTTTLISSLLGEAIGVMALITSFLGGGRVEVILLGVIGLMMVLSNYPRRAAWEEAVEHFAATLPQ